MINCLDCAKLKRENEQLQTEVIRMGQMWLELKKFIISQEQGPNKLTVSHGEPRIEK